ncbi:MAG TPA: hypothetical protein EYP31_08800, partial [Roseibacterium sp.]|nr:hypothetical protein [Roseibacterium sp.]
MKIVSKILATIVFLVITLLALLPLAAGLGESMGTTIAFVGAALVALVVLFAPTGRRAWGRGFLLDGALFFALPLLIVPLLSRAYDETVANAEVVASASEAAAASVGAGLGVAAAFGAFSIVGIIFGVIFLVFGA